MNKVEIEGWLWSARDAVKNHLGLGEAWWPMTNTTGHTDRQAQASAWALAFFITAARERCSGASLKAACHVGGENDVNSYRQTLLTQLWLGGERDHSQHEVLVDFSVHNWNAANPIQLTGESETYPSHGTGDSLERPDDYSWDFYKLLVVPSVTRLFFARVAGHGGVDAVTRVIQLTKTLQGLVDFYGPALLRHHDELGAVVVPASSTAATDTRILWLERGRLRCDRSASPPDLQQERLAARAAAPAPR